MNNEPETQPRSGGCSPPNCSTIRVKKDIVIPKGTVLETCVSKRTEYNPILYTMEMGKNSTATISLTSDAVNERPDLFDF